MVNTTTPVCDFGKAAIDFELPGVDGQDWNLNKARGENGLLVFFICNHCPFVKAIHESLVADLTILRNEFGINSIAIMSNDPKDYPEDSFENMKVVSDKWKFPFPYVLDESQQIAKAYGAVCTPDYFGYNSKLELQFRGRLDASNTTTAPNGVKRDLLEAMKTVSQTGKGPKDQIPSIGCSIKWK